MKRHNWLTASLTALLVAASPVLAQDAKETLRNIPDDALGFVLVNHLNQGNEKISALAKKMTLPLPGSPLELAKAAMGMSKGLNDKGCAAVFLMPGSDGKPVPAFLVPVSDYPAFLGQFNAKDDGINEIKLPAGESYLVAKKGKHAVLVDLAHSKTFKAMLKGTKSVALSEAVQAWVEENDLTVVATPAGIKLAMTAARAGMAQSRPNLNQAQMPPFMARWLDMTEGWLKTFESDVTYAALAAKIDTAGNVHLDARALFAKGSGLAKGAGGVKAMQGGALADFPQGPFALAMSGVMSESFLQESVKISADSFKMQAKAAGEEITKGQEFKMEKAMSASMKGIRGMGFYVGAAPKEGDSLFAGIAAFMKVENSAAYLEHYSKSAMEVTTLYKDLKIPGLDKIEQHVKKTKVGKFDALEVTSKIDVANLVGDPLQKKLMEAMYGPKGKMVTTVVAINPSTLVMLYQPAEAAAKILADTQKLGLHKDARVAPTMAMLPEGSQWVMLVDPKGAMDVARIWVKTMAPGMNVNLPDFPRTPPVGLGVKLSETGLIFHMVVPSEVLETIGKLFMQKRAV